MATIEEELNSVLDADFYGDLAEQLIINLHRSYLQAGDLVDSIFMAPEAHDLIGHVRRGFIEQGIRTQAALIPNVSATSEKTAEGRSYFSKVASGKLTLTVSAAESPACLPRDAKYRKGYSVLQRSLFDPPPENDGAYYAIITHGPSYGSAQSDGLIGFCQVAFPDHEYKCFVHQVDLKKNYAELFARLQAGEEIVIGQATAELRERIRRAKAS